jgi:pyridoxamine 5'-phosphate oxidase
MTRLNIPNFYNDLSLTLRQIQKILDEGVINRRAAAHHPVVATIDANGCPSQRVMILRKSHWAQSSLRFHTDLRSEKIREIAGQPIASVLIYDEAAKLQIRLSGALSFGTTKTAWMASTEFARRCYMTQSAPGSSVNEPMSGLPEWIEGKQPTLEMLQDAGENFVLLQFVFNRIDWLYLSNYGHRRAKFTRDLEGGTAWACQWLIP